MQGRLSYGVVVSLLEKGEAGDSLRIIDVPYLLLTSCQNDIRKL